MGALAMLVAGLAAACDTQRAGAPVGTGTGSGSGAGALPAEVVYLDADGFANDTVGAISDHPIDAGVFQSWLRTGTTGDNAVAARNPGLTYVAVTGRTRCRTPERAELVRTGADLTARFIGGEEPQTCTREVGPVAVFAVTADVVSGVRTVGGKPPLDPAGPGHLEDFVELGTAPGAADLEPAELGAAGSATLAQALRQAGAPDRAVATLATAPPPGRRGFAFVLHGCAEVDAALVIHHSAITAKLLGNPDTACDAPLHFLATFTIDAARVPETAKLGFG